MYFLEGSQKSQMKYNFLDPFFSHTKILILIYVVHKISSNSLLTQINLVLATKQSLKKPKLGVIKHLNNLFQQQLFEKYKNSLIACLFSKILKIYMSLSTIFRKEINIGPKTLSKMLGIRCWKTLWLIPKKHWQSWKGEEREVSKIVCSCS